MSVLECDRYECGNIMCDRYSDEHGYLCRECYDELSRGSIINVANFMASKPARDDKAVEAYYNELFKLT